MPLINDPTAILVYLISLIGLIYFIKQQPWASKVFDIIPPVIWVYFLPMISTTLGITPEQSDLYSWVKTYLLPAAVVTNLLFLYDAGYGTIKRKTEFKFRHNSDGILQTEFRQNSDGIQTESKHNSNGSQAEFKLKQNSNGIQT